MLKKIIAIYCGYLAEHTIHHVGKCRDPFWVLMRRVKYSIQCSADGFIYRLSREERSIFWEVIVSVILSKKLYTNMCPVPNGFRDRAI